MYIVFYKICKKKTIVLVASLLNVFYHPIRILVTVYSHTKKKIYSFLCECGSVTYVDFEKIISCQTPYYIKKNNFINIKRNLWKMQI